MSTIACGIWLRRHPLKNVAVKTSGIMHLITLLTLIIPWIIGLAWLDYYDELLGIPPLPFRTISGAVGVVMMLAGFGFISVSMLVLLERGQGLFVALEITKKLVAKDIYARTRNPMSLGLYLIWIAPALLSGSMSFTLWALTALIPAHIFYLKYFEEYELEIRFGQPYREYKQRVPLLIPKFRKVSGTEPADNND